ncbi:hypothetical protein [Actinoplanes sp. CA-252034]|uniref:hypothetical protein n=1 Tax=Actinoplanes sp. CA-252034 TaxID=3239906 RepID=UPI003D96E916
MTDNPVVNRLKNMPSPGRLAPVAAERTGHGRVQAPAEEPIGIPVPAARPDLSRRLPDDVALLKVIATEDAHGRPRFRLEGYFRGRVWTGDEADEAGHVKPRMAIDDALRARPGEVGSDAALTAAVEYYEFIMAWSSTKHSLRSWLTRLQDAAGSSLRLVIWDDTDAGIPWELYRITGDGPPVWLGAAFQVTRWTTIHDTGRHAQFSASAEPRQSGAEIICYEDQALVRETGLSIRSVAACSVMDTLVGLLRMLESEARHFGLVYVRAHGRHGDTLHSATLDGISLAKFETLQLRAVRASGSLVLLNACNSARPVFDPALGDHANRNFAEIFLRHRARAVVATIGEVPTSTSAALARSLIAQARSRGVRLPEFLRDRRARAARDLPADTLDLEPGEQEAIQDFLYASRYVYFGHPDTVFMLEEPT